MKTVCFLLTFLFLIAAPVQQLYGQTSTTDSRAVTSSLKRLHDITGNYLMRTAEMLDPEMYGYQPTDEVRTTGQLLAHVANAQFMFCSMAADQENPSSENFEESATTKEEIVEALRSSFDYCAGIYDGMTDTSGAEMRQVFGNEMAASAVLAFNSTHNYEHYGNLVTYMRINGITPPSSQ